MDDDFKVTLRDAKMSGYCISGVRWWAAENGIDFKDWAKNGLSARVMEALNDGQADIVVREARERRRGRR